MSPKHAGILREHGKVQLRLKQLVYSHEEHKHVSNDLTNQPFKEPHEDEIENGAVVIQYCAIALTHMSSS
jgi:hypothetical protein